MAASGGNMRIVVLGGGFGGVATVRHLEKVLRRRANVDITLVSRENFFVITPLLFEACSGRLELRHCAQPIRAALQRAPPSKPMSNRLTSNGRSFEPWVQKAAHTICPTTIW